MIIYNEKNRIFNKYKPLFVVCGIKNKTDQYRIGKSIEDCLLKYNMYKDVRFTSIIIPVYMKLMKIFSKDGSEKDVDSFMTMIKDDRFKKEVEKL